MRAEMLKWSPDKNDSQLADIWHHGEDQEKLLFSLPSHFLIFCYCLLLAQPNKPLTTGTNWWSHPSQVQSGAAKPRTERRHRRILPPQQHGEHFWVLFKNFYHSPTSPWGLYVIELFKPPTNSMKLLIFLSLGENTKKQRDWKIYPNLCSLS